MAAPTVYRAYRSVDSDPFQFEFAAFLVVYLPGISDVNALDEPAISKPNECRNRRETS